MDESNRFGDNLRRLRTMNGYTLQELAGESGVAMATIGQIEHGASCRLATALRLAAVFGVTVDEMAREELCS